MQTEWRLPEGTARPLAVAGVILVAIGVAFWWFSAPVQETPIPTVSRPQPSGVAQSSGHVIVDVVGAVRHPGVVRLTTGARVVDAVAAVGGVLRGHDPVVNMARLVVDGEQIVIGAPTASTATDAASGRVDINHATAAQLDALPGIGPVLAQRIVEYRSAHGPFRHARDLTDVPGIGDSTFANLAAAVSAS